MLFKTGEYADQFSEWDDDGLPTLDAKGKKIKKKDATKYKELMDLAIVENQNVPIPTVPKTEPPPEVKLRVGNAAWQEILDNTKETLLQEAQQKVIKEFQEGKRL